MKIIVEYRILDGTPLRRGPKALGVKVINEQELPPDHSADFPLQRIEFFVQDNSETARVVFDALGLLPRDSAGS